MEEELRSLRENIAQWKKHGLDQDDPVGYRKLLIRLLRLKITLEVV